MPKLKKIKFPKERQRKKFTWTWVYKAHFKK